MAAPFVSRNAKTAPMLALNITSAVSIASAAYIAASGKPAETWGWFLFVGVLLAGTDIVWKKSD